MFLEAVRYASRLIKHGLVVRHFTRQTLNLERACLKKIRIRHFRQNILSSFSQSQPSSIYVNRDHQYLCATKITSCSSRNFSSKSSQTTKYVRLMDMAELVWPNPAMSLSNWVKGKLISGYYDITFNTKEFLSGAQQAVETVSSLISKGKFDELNGLVDRKIIPEVEKNYERLSEKQRNFIEVSVADIYYPFVYEIGMMFDDEREKRYVEIMTVFQGIHGSNELRQQPLSDITAQLESDPTRMFVCNYRFFREFTKGVNDDWTINALNHFSPQELVKRFPYGK